MIEKERELKRLRDSSVTSLVERRLSGGLEKVSLLQYRHFGFKSIADLTNDTGFLKYWQYSWRYYKSIADTIASDTYFYCDY
jgi:hypothetical protein